MFIPAGGHSLEVTITYRIFETCFMRNYVVNHTLRLERRINYYAFVEHCALCPPPPPGVTVQGHRVMFTRWLMLTQPERAWSQGKLIRVMNTVSCTVHAKWHAR